MSLKGTQPASVLGSHAVLSPSACMICCANATHGVANKTCPREGFRPEGRKKLVSAAATHGAPVVRLNPQGVPPLPTPNGPNEAPEFGSPRATCQFASSGAVFTAFTLMGRFRWRPPLKLYSKLSDMLWPSSCSKVKLAWCET